jgi:hypothetical protein
MESNGDNSQPIGARRKDAPPSELISVWLQNELAERIRLNPRYGQNALAKSVGISGSQLPRLLSGSSP